MTMVYEYTASKVNVRHMTAGEDGYPPCGRRVALHIDTLKVGTGKREDALIMTCGPCFKMTVGE